MAKWIFWLSLCLPLYAYLGFPLLLLLIEKIKRPTPPQWGTVDEHSVSVVIAAHNEAQYIQAKLKSILTQSYLPDALQIIVASDGSTDQTVALAQSIADPRIQVLDLPRAGKIGALNQALKHVTESIIVFTDADNHWLDNTLEEILLPFQDPSVGACAGHMIIDKTGTSLSQGDSWYRHYEAWVRNAENNLGCTVSADGALIAIRSELLEPIPNDVNDDFFISTCAPKQHKKIFFTPKAIVLDEGVDETNKQFSRRIRVTVGGLQSLATRKSLMNPKNYGLYALSLISHKLLRRLAPLCLIPLFFANAALIEQHPLFLMSFIGQVIVYGIAIAGLLDKQNKLPKAFKIPSYVVLGLAGMTSGCWFFLRGKRYTLWNPQQNR